MWTNTVRSIAGAIGLSIFLTTPQLSCAVAAELDVRSNGPNIDLSVGTLFSVNDQTGTIRDFNSLRGKHGLIALFSHSFDW